MLIQKESLQSSKVDNVSATNDTFVLENHQEDLIKAIESEEKTKKSISMSFSRRNRNKSMDHSKSFHDIREKNNSLKLNAQ
jgi:hypothetical protein